MPGALGARRTCLPVQSELDSWEYLRKRSFFKLSEEFNCLNKCRLGKEESHLCLLFRCLCWSEYDPLPRSGLLIETWTLRFSSFQADLNMQILARHECMNGSLEQGDIWEPGAHHQHAPDHSGCGAPFLLSEHPFIVWGVIKYSSRQS